VKHASHRHSQPFLFPSAWPDLAARLWHAELALDKTHRAGESRHHGGRSILPPYLFGVLGSGSSTARDGRDGIDLQIISATPVLFAYERPVETWRWIVRNCSTMRRLNFAAGEKAD